MYPEHRDFRTIPAPTGLRRYRVFYTTAKNPDELSLVVEASSPQHATEKLYAQLRRVELGLTGQTAHDDPARFRAVPETQ